MSDDGTAGDDLRLAAIGVALVGAGVAVVAYATSRFVRRTVRRHREQ